MGLTRPRAEQIYNLDYKQATRVATTTNITLAGGAPAQVDGVTLVTNDRILVTGQSTASQNGIYDVVSVGTGSNGTWVRTNDANATGEVEAGMIVMVTEGQIYADTQWKLITDNPITIGVTALIFTQNYSANSISGGTSNVTVYSNANVTISSAGTPNVLTISSTGVVISGTESVTGTITVGNILTGGLISATGNITGGNLISNGLITAASTVGGVITGSSASVTGDVSGANVLANSNISAAGNISVAGELLGLGNVSVVGNASANFVYSAGDISASGNVLANGAIFTYGTISSAGNITGANLIGPTNAFSVIVANGQSNVFATTSNQTLTLTTGAGSGLAWVTDPANNIITLDQASAGSSIFATGGDMGLVTDAVTASEDLGSVIDAYTVAYDLGPVISAGGLVYPTQLVLPAYTAGTLPTAAPPGQFVFLSTSSIGAMTAFSDGTNWRFTSSGNIVS